MNIAIIASGIFAIAKAIPKLMEAIEKLSELYTDHKLAQLERKYGKKDMELRALVSAVKGAKTNEDRMAISRLLFRYKSGKL